IDHPAAWGKCEGTWEVTGEEPAVLTVDMSMYHDSSAVLECTKLADGRIGVTAKIWEPGHGRVDHSEVFGYIRQKAEDLGPRFRGVVYDERFFEVPALMLEDDGIGVIRFSQTVQFMAPAASETFDAILTRQIVHRGDLEFSRQVLAAARREQDRGTFTLSKGKSKRRIDACVALCMGVYELNRLPAKVNAVNTVW
ncbi:MAG TPA: hypothetical protein VN714_14955, partial [Trebonia sp.]|nr:hypothetical protein [Trebonia sp.]